MNAQLCDPLLLDFAGNALSRLDETQIEHLMERSAILSSEAGLEPHALCDALALLEVLRLHPAVLTGVTVLQVELEGTNWWLTTNLEAARRTLHEAGGVELAVADLADIVDVQFGGVALLCTSP